MVAIPEGYVDLLERPLYGHLATTRPDGTAQVNPMWFDWDGELLRFTHTTPPYPYEFLEVRGDVYELVPDPDGVVIVVRPTAYSKQ